MNQTFYPSILLLEDGTKYHGWSFTNSIFSIGEIVFNTGMTGYQEILTDPSYAGQIITFTYPEIGNTGINNEDNESNRIHIQGLIAKNICLKPSNWRYQISFIEYILHNEIPHIFGIDTRTLTKHLRNVGVMNACISSKILDYNIIENMTKKNSTIDNINLITKVTTIDAYEYKYNISDKYPITYSHLNNKINETHGISLNIVVLDFGVKNNILLRLLNYGCKINVLPANSDYKLVQSYKPDGILLSNGPGDPSQIKDIINNIKNLIKISNIPIFGICMGHQILSLALGGETFKLKFGHRGLNHPTGISQTAKITSQNHGFAVKIDSLNNANLVITNYNLNDSTVASIIHKNKPIFSVQYHPEASPGPHDSDYLFSHFITLIKLMKIK